MQTLWWSLCLARQIIRAMVEWLSLSCRAAAVRWLEPWGHFISFPKPTDSLFSSFDAVLPLSCLLLHVNNESLPERFWNRNKQDHGKSTSSKDPPSSPSSICLIHTWSEEAQETLMLKFRLLTLDTEGSQITLTTALTLRFLIVVGGHISVGASQMSQH